MEVITARTAKPPKGYSDSQWQIDFQKLKESVIPSSAKKMTIPRGSSCGSYESYHGDTQYQYYCQMINDILSNIRHGGEDYCFYIYQVADLLRFEHDRLEVKWLQGDECFLIRLKN